MEWISDPQAWVAFLTLLALEIVLGIDNIIFISILAGKLPVEQQARARYIGLGLALVIRVILLFSLSWGDRTHGTSIHCFQPGNFSTRSNLATWRVVSTW